WYSAGWGGWSSASAMPSMAVRSPSGVEAKAEGIAGWIAGWWGVGAMAQATAARAMGAGADPLSENASGWYSSGWSGWSTAPATRSMAVVASPAASAVTRSDNMG